MPMRIDANAIVRLQARLDRLRHIDPTPLLERGERIMAEDNERGILTGTDKDGLPLVPLKSPRKGKYKGATGPPLAPFGARSRVIDHFVTGHGHDAESGRWEVVGLWDAVISAKGVPFLPFHFDGTRTLPVRDLAGVRPQGRARWSAAVADWVRTHLMGG